MIDREQLEVSRCSIAGNIDSSVVHPFASDLTMASVDEDELFAEQDRQIRVQEAAAKQSWDAFPPNVQGLLDDFASAVDEFASAEDDACLEQFRGWWAARKGSLDALGLTVNTQVDMQGRTALGTASFYNLVETVRFLVAVCGADVNLKDTCFGAPPLIIAAISKYSFHPACVRVLLELGADPHLRNVYDKTALECVREQNRQEYVDILEQWRPLVLEG